VLEEFLAELMDHGEVDAPLAVYEPSISSKPLVAINAEIDDENIIVEPPVGDPDFVPINKVELAKSLFTISKSVPPDDIGKFYKDVKELFLSLKDTGTVMNIDPWNETNEVLLRKKIRKLIREAWDEDESGYSIIDPAAELAAEKAEEEEERRRRDPALQAAQKNLRDKKAYREIAKEVGLSVGGARGEDVRSRKRYNFLMNILDLAPDAYKKMKSEATEIYLGELLKSKKISQEELVQLQEKPYLINDLDKAKEYWHENYINYIIKTGELSDEEILDLRNTPALVEELEGYQRYIAVMLPRATNLIEGWRKHMRKMITRLAKEYGIDLNWESDWDEDRDAEFAQKIRPLIRRGA